MSEVVKKRRRATTDGIVTDDGPRTSQSLQSLPKKKPKKQRESKEAPVVTGKGKKIFGNPIKTSSKKGRKNKRKGSLDDVFDGVDSRQEGTLYVTINRGRDIGTNINKKNSFVTVKSSIGKQRYKTKVVRKNFDPIWDEEFEFFMDTLKGQLNFNVFYTKRNKSVELGVVMVQLNGLTPNQMMETWLNIEETSKKSKSIDESLFIPPKLFVSIYYQGYSENPNRGNNILNFDDMYELGDVLGDGGFSVVHSAIHKQSRKEWAVKVVDKRQDEEEIEVLRREIEIMKRLKHDNIIHLEETFEDDTFLYLVLELAAGGELFDVIVEKDFFPESEAINIIKQLLRAVSYLHANGIAHRDLKPENILLIKPGDTDVKISDFGLSKDFDSDVLTTSCGTPDYVAPEVLLGMPYDNSVDIWSIGVIAYILLCGYPPFYGDDDQETFNKILRGEFGFPSPEWDVISQEAKKFISAILVLNFNTRPSAVQCLRSPWIMKSR